MKTLFFVAVLIVTVSSQAFCQTAEGYLVKGHAFLGRNRPLQAESQYLQALELSSQLGEAHEGLGKIYQERQHYSTAITHYQLALSLQLNHPEIYIQLAFCQQKNGSIDEAVRTYLSLIEIYPKLPGAYLGLGGLYDIQGTKQKAEAAYINYRALKQ